MTGSSLARKAFHISGATIPLAYLLFDRPITLIFAAFLLALFSVLELLRIKGYIELPGVKKHLKNGESRRPTGSLFFLISSLATLLIFSKQAAVPALFVLSLSDPFSSFVGFRFGRTPLAGKSVEGALAFFLSAYLILALFGFRVHVVVLAAFAASLTELFSSRLIDDNLWIPIVTALVLTLLGA
jgi:dolichol kinase